MELLSTFDRSTVSFQAVTFKASKLKTNLAPSKFRIPVNGGRDISLFSKKRRFLVTFPQQ